MGAVAAPCCSEDSGPMPVEHIDQKMTQIEGLVNPYPGGEYGRSSTVPIKPQDMNARNVGDANNPVSRPESIEDIFGMGNMRMPGHYEKVSEPLPEDEQRRQKQIEDLRAKVSMAGVVSSSESPRSPR
eukprot:gnl/TRDRNA2_/TRDRNA2_162656_c0_seq2.p1 gnl/TRDRNA2_/TRDRNA2_162656_c0~~gnl/TRDRNA2_/TRDRNA2_162656_c0_seq2.p1  ORF type:complete len:128 (+),score=18.68 gnl/TRDRNA2_/TRDRNA2_162656_c0_seq2:108-491(+)